jgi:GNAT superfamily N-acetyltransferase
VTRYVLPGDNVFPEGVTAGPGTTFFAGSLGDGTITSCPPPYSRGVTDLAGLLAAYDAQMREEPPQPPPGLRYEHDGPLMRVVGRHQGFISTPRDMGLRGAELDALIAAQRDYFAARNESVEWKTWAYDEPADLPDRLRAAGFEPETLETVVIGLASEMAAEPVLPDGVTLRAVTADADMHAIGRMQTIVWDEDCSWQAGELIAAVATIPGEISVWVAEAGGEVVSAARLEFRPGTDFAGLWGGSTLKQWRGKGIYRALVAKRAQLAVARGVRYLQVDASPDSAPILRRLGFRAVTTTTPYVWTPPATSA